jgi:hypothetical protein
MSPPTSLQIQTRVGRTEAEARLVSRRVRLARAGFFEPACFNDAHWRHSRKTTISLTSRVSGTAVTSLHWQANRARTALAFASLSPDALPEIASSPGAMVLEQKLPVPLRLRGASQVQLEAKQGLVKGWRI